MRILIATRGPDGAYRMPDEVRAALEAPVWDPPPEARGPIFVIGEDALPLLGLTAEAWVPTAQSWRVRERRGLLEQGEG